jgi:hypothetical protein
MDTRIAVILIGVLIAVAAALYLLLLVIVGRRTGEINTVSRPPGIQGLIIKGFLAHGTRH